MYPQYTPVCSSDLSARRVQTGKLINIPSAATTQCRERQRHTAELSEAIETSETTAPQHNTTRAHDMQDIAHNERDHQTRTRARILEPGRRAAPLRKQQVDANERVVVGVKHEAILEAGVHNAHCGEQLQIQVVVGLRHVDE